MLLKVGGALSGLVTKPEARVLGSFVRGGTFPGGRLSTFAVPTRRISFQSEKNLCERTDGRTYIRTDRQQDWLYLVDHRLKHRHKIYDTSKHDLLIYRVVRFAIFCFKLFATLSPLDT